ncbi:MAG: hypothetical protein AYK22_08360 [Thermoplasmatales archaeon SG8-52-3]|jgi:uncharacterized membrane protein|nr:MAG: hypothetical protein AYK22_08360 [Thermoplasmatales archaeon SG8-52-3]
MKLLERLRRNPINFYVFILLIIVVIIIAGLLFAPSIFYDQWIWKYYWGPIVADASGSVAIHNGIEAREGYTVVSEITYGIILIIALYAIYKLLDKLNITVDWRFALALMPYILFGPISRVLEDSNYFNEPLEYWFISPLIYLQIAFYAIFFLLLGYFVEKKFKNRIFSVNKIIFFGGLIFFIPSLYLISIWILGDRWGNTTGVRFDVFLIVLGLIFLIVGLVFLISYILRKNEKIAIYKNPLNLAMLSGHLMDGITSYISIKDPFSMGLFYAEKHPASNVLLNIWGPLFPIVKFLLIIAVVYVFDVMFKEELKNHITLVNLLKIGILILGFSPGLRDLLRVTMGV